MFRHILPLTCITAISNEIAVGTFLQFDVINFCDAARCTTHTLLCLCLLYICAHRVLLLSSPRSQKCQKTVAYGVLLSFSLMSEQRALLKSQKGKEGECIVDRTHRKEVLLWVGKTERTDYKFYHVYSIRNDHTTVTAPLPVCSAKLSTVGPG